MNKAGRRGPDDCISFARTTIILGVTDNTLRSLMRRGVLLPLYDDKNRPVFSRLEVEIIRDSQSRGRDKTLPDVAAVACQALAIARVAQQRLADLQDLLGLNHVALDRGEETLHRLWEAVGFQPSAADLCNIEWIRHWAGTFFAMDAVYLDLISTYTASPEPWKPFYDFSSSVLLLAPAETVRLSPALQAAYAYFEAARKHLFVIGYHYCRARHGAHAASRIFPNAKTAVEAVMDCLPV